MRIDQYQGVQYQIAERAYKAKQIEFILRVMLFVMISLLFIGYARKAKADTFTPTISNPLHVDEMFIEYRKIQNLRDPYFDSSKDNLWNDQAEFHIELSIYKYLYWENNLHFRTDETQVRQGGWEYRIGFHLMPWLDVFKYHHSQHCFECETPRKFPLEDSYGVRVYFKTK